MFYPVYLNLKGRRVVVVGGGEVAERKVESLLEAEASPVVISPDVTRSLSLMAEENQIEWRNRKYTKGDCTGAALVFSATNDPEVSRAVYAEATELGLFVNTADQPALCSFIMPAVVRRGDIGIAISTGGTSPALAARLRRKISRVIGPEYAQFSQLMVRARREIRSRVASERERRELHYRIIDSDIIELLRRNDREAAERRLHEMIQNP
jgi:precorrin-2 dehydrogenase/sirohydrochlorin ferrochelatase